MAKRAVEWMRYAGGRGAMIVRVGDVRLYVYPRRGMRGGPVMGWTWSAARSGAEVKGHTDTLAQAQADALRAVPAVRRAGAILCTYLGAASDE